MIEIRWINPRKGKETIKKDNNKFNLNFLKNIKEVAKIQTKNKRKKVTTDKADVGGTKFRNTKSSDQRIKVSNLFMESSF